jgi:hypothetical protein
VYVSLFAGLALVSCGNTPPGGYLSQTATSITFIQFTATGQNQQQITGNINEVVENTNDNPPDLRTSTTAFTGVENGSSLTLTISFFGISSSYTGTLNGGTLILDLPQSGGSIQATEFVASSLQQYNQAVTALQKQIANQAQHYNDAQATATAIQSTATAQQQEQQAVQDANQQLANDLSALQQDSNTLSGFSESSTLQGYANDWQQMQNDYATEQQQAQQGCGPSNTNQAQVSRDSAQVDRDEAQINRDDAQFSRDQNQYNLDTSAAQTDIQNIQNAWTQLQQAVVNNPSGTPAALYSASDVNNAIGQGNAAIKTAQGTWGGAQSSVTQYDQEASKLQKQADAIPGNMNCN